MGAASYFEDDLNRILGNISPPLQGGRAAEPSFGCPYCTEIFPLQRELINHLDVHRSQRPLLLLSGREPSRSDYVRERHEASEIRLVNCSAASIRIDGGIPQAVPINEVPTALAGLSDALVDLDLHNKFEAQAAPILQSYTLTFVAPDRNALDEVDRAFRDALATGSPHMSQVDAFLADPRTQGIARQYADALAAYVVGVLVRDQAPGTGSTLPPAESAKKYGSALDDLKGYRRLLPNVVCSLVRFAKNDFSEAGRPTGIARLDAATAMLLPLAGKPILPSGQSANGRRGRLVPLCPIDQATDRILDLAQRLARLTRWGKPTAEDCAQAAESSTFDSSDRAKVLALWGATVLRLGAAREALEPLRRLRNTFPFDDWADKQLERIERE